MKGEKLIVYSLTEGDIPEVVFDLCHPGDISDRENYEGLYEGEIFAQKRWIKFSKGISEKVMPLIENESQLQKSRILESIKFIKEKHFSHIKSNDSKNHKLVIWSDMLQNGDKVSHFNGLEDVKSVEEKYPFRLNGVDIFLFYLKSEKYSELQTTEHQHWWIDFFRLTEGNLKPPAEL